MHSHRQYLTPPQVAERLGVAPETVIGWIRSGELQGANLATTTARKRPRFRVAESALDEFIARRTVGQRPAPPRPPRRKPATEVIQFF